MEQGRLNKVGEGKVGERRAGGGWQGRGCKRGRDNYHERHFKTVPWKPRLTKRLFNFFFHFLKL